MVKRYPLLAIIATLLAGCAGGLRAQTAPKELTAGPLTCLHDGFQFTEGPAADATGNVFFTDIPNNRIHKWTLDGKLETFRENSGGSNGLMFDARGDLVMCEGSSRRVTQLDPEGNLTVLADRYDGKRLNSPNDLWIDGRGGIYFSDPCYGSTADLEQDGRHVYYIPPDASELKRVTEDLVNPNGLIGTADGKLLYIADHGADKTYVYDIQPDGTLANKRRGAGPGRVGQPLPDHGRCHRLQCARQAFGVDRGAGNPGQRDLRRGGP